MSPIFMIAAWSLFFASCNEKQTNSTISEADSVATPNNSSEIDTTGSMPFANATNKLLDTLRTVSYTRQADEDFLQIMKIHQAASITMYEALVRNSKSPQLIGLCQKIVSRLSTELAFLNGYRLKPSTYEKSDFSDKALNMLDSLTANGLSMHGAYLDLDFATMMIQHHHNAIAVADLYAEYNTDEKLIRFATSLISSHKQDVTQLEGWKKKFYPSAMEFGSRSADSKKVPVQSP